MMMNRQHSRSSTPHHSNHSRRSAPKHDGFWVKAKPRAAQLRRCEANARKGGYPKGLAEVNRLLVDGFRAGDISPMEGTLATIDPKRGGAPATRVMTLFEVSPRGPVFYTNPGAKVDELRADPRASLFLWFPLLGGLAVIDGRCEIGELVPPPPVKKGQEPPCPCEVPSGFPITLVPEKVQITRFEAGKFAKSEFTEF